MGSVRNAAATVKVVLGPFSEEFRDFYSDSPEPAHVRAGITSGLSLGVTVWDLFYVGLTVVVFAVLLLIVKGVTAT
jgi:hypothetical protein